MSAYFISMMEKYETETLALIFSENWKTHHFDPDCRLAPAATIDYARVLLFELGRTTSYWEPAVNRQPGFRPGDS